MMVHANYHQQIVWDGESNIVVTVIPDTYPGETSWDNNQIQTEPVLAGDSPTYT